MRQWRVRLLFSECKKIKIFAEIKEENKLKILIKLRILVNFSEIKEENQLTVAVITEEYRFRET